MHSDTGIREAYCTDLILMLKDLMVDSRFSSSQLVYMRVLCPGLVRLR